MQFVCGITKEDRGGKRSREIISKIVIIIIIIAEKRGVFNIIIAVFLAILINT